MAKKRQLVLIKLADPDDRLSATVPLGTRAEFLDALSRFNTAPDGTEFTSGTLALHGPGFVVEIATAITEIKQALVTCHDEEIAWHVLRAICKDTGWKMQDMETGHMFG
ncbi:MAG: hypothetical protein AAF235_03580 [Planctomycetota bacterium]